MAGTWPERGRCCGWAACGLEVRALRLLLARGGGWSAEVVRVEHALALSRTLPHAKLAILPGGHGDYIGEICATNEQSKVPDLVVAMIDEFLGG